MPLLETPRSRELSAWLGALLLHVAALSAVRGAFVAESAEFTPRAVLAPATSSEVDVEFGEASEPAAQGASDPDVRADTVDPSASSVAAKLGARRAVRDETRKLAAAGSEFETDEVAEPIARALTPDAELAEPEAAKSEATAARPSQPIDLGIGPDAWRNWTRAERAAPENSAEEPGRKRRPLVRAPTPSKTGGLQEGMEAADRERGLGPSGRVATALFQAAHSEVAPQLGVAHFSITVLRTGAVEVSLTGANRESDKWRAVAARAALALRKSPPRIPPSRNGVRLTLDLTAEETFPNGAKPTELRGPHLEVDGPVFQSSEAAQAELADLNPVAATTKGATVLPPVIVKLPGVYLSGRGKVCSYRIGLSALGPLLQGGCDPSNIGAKPQRMVRVAVQDQSFF